jgi:hypothetical protein
MLVREDILTKEKDRYVIEDEANAVERVCNQIEYLQCSSLGDTLQSQHPCFRSEA